MSIKQVISDHKYVEFLYRVVERDGEVLEQIDAPVHYVHGTENWMFPKIEESLAGCEVGDSVAVSLSPDEGFGDYHQELVYTDSVKNVPEEFQQLGAEVDFQSDRGEVRQFKVTHIENGKLTLDGNHPLAGKQLTFHIDIVSVRDATTEEIKEGYGVSPEAPLH